MPILQDIAELISRLALIIFAVILTVLNSYSLWQFSIGDNNPFTVSDIIISLILLVLIAVSFNLINDIKKCKIQMILANIIQKF